MKNYEVFYSSVDSKYYLIQKGIGETYFYIHSDYDNEATASEVKYALESVQFRD